MPHRPRRVRSFGTLFTAALLLAACGRSGFESGQAVDVDCAVATACQPASSSGDCTTDRDGDGHVAIACGGDDCDDDPATCGAHCYPGNPEPDVCDGYPQDCSGLIADGSGDPRLGTACDGDDSDLCLDDVYEACTLGVLVCSSGTDTLEGLAAPGTCTDVVDNDCSGLADAADPQCAELVATFDGVDLGDWSVASGTSWSLQAGGVLSYSNAEVAPAVLVWDLPGAWGDVDVSVDLNIQSSDRLANWADLERIVFRVQDSGTFCAVFVTDYYAPSSNSFGDGQAFIGVEGWSGGTRTGFQQTSVGLSVDSWHTLRAVVRGTSTPTVDAYLDGSATPAISWTPTCPASGLVGLSASETHVLFDNFTIRPAP